MHLTPQSQAMVLLTVSFGKSDPTKAKPLSNNEWARFATWLKDHDLQPATLLHGDLPTVLAGWIDRSVSVARLERLLGRGAALGLSLEKWQRAGLWILTRSDPEYPERLKRHLRSDSPAVLFGCGNKALLKNGGVAIVGLRNASAEDLGFTGNFAMEAANQGCSIISGGAQGVDQSAMLGALDSDGTAVGVLADSLLKSATSAKYRRHIMSGNLLLISSFNPEAGFNVGNAMARNRYIYCLADAAIVISSTPDKGGTWNGGLENLKAGWVPLWVKHNMDANSGNSKLVESGAQWLPNNPVSLTTLLHGPQDTPTQETQPVLPLLNGNADPTTSAESDNGAAELKPLKTKTLETQPALEAIAEKPAIFAAREVARDFYSLFLMRLLAITAESPMKAEDIAVQLELEKSQASVWLKRAVSDRKAKKLTNPVRYQFVSVGQQQVSMFGEDP